MLNRITEIVQNRSVRESCVNKITIFAERYFSYILVVLLCVVLSVNFYKLNWQSIIPTDFDGRYLAKSYLIYKFNYIIASLDLRILGAFFYIANIWVLYRVFSRRVERTLIISSLLIISVNSSMLRFSISDTYGSLLMLEISVLVFLFLKLSDKIVTPFVPPRKKRKYWILFSICFVIIMLTNSIIGWVSLIALVLYLLIKRRWFQLIFTIPIAVLGLLIEQILFDFIPEIRIFSDDIYVIRYIYSSLLPFFKTIPQIFSFDLTESAWNNTIVFLVVSMMFLLIVDVLNRRNRSFFFVWILIVLSVFVISISRLWIFTPQRFMAFSPFIVFLIFALIYNLLGRKKVFFTMFYLALFLYLLF